MSKFAENTSSAWERSRACPSDLKNAKDVTFCLAFVATQEQIDALAPGIARKAGGDAIVWFAYPKGTSKKYKSEIHAVREPSTRPMPSSLAE